MSSQKHFQHPHHDMQYLAVRSHIWRLKCKRLLKGVVSWCYFCFATEKKATDIAVLKIRVIEQKGNQYETMGILLGINQYD